MPDSFIVLSYFSDSLAVYNFQLNLFPSSFGKYNSVVLFYPVKKCDTILIFNALVYDQLFLSVRLYKYQRQRESWAPVACTCNPSYSGGRDQEDRH
jgi:hypothetical protein